MKLILILLAIAVLIYYKYGLPVVAFLGFCVIDLWLIYLVADKTWHGLYFAALIYLAVAATIANRIFAYLETHWPQ